MLYTIIGFFSLAAILGMVILSYVLQTKPTPKGLVFIHGPVAAIGIVLLAYYCFYHTPSPIESLVLFVIAALGGAILIFKDLTHGTVPKWLAVGHGLIAITGFVFLLSFVWKDAV